MDSPQTSRVVRSSELSTSAKFQPPHPPAFLSPAALVPPPANVQNAYSACAAPQRASRPAQVAESAAAALAPRRLSFAQAAEQAAAPLSPAASLGSAREAPFAPRAPRTASRVEGSTEGELQGAARALEFLNVW
jgi:hypothetical protein